MAPGTALQDSVKATHLGVEEELQQRLYQLEAIYRMTAMASRAARLAEIYEAALDCLEGTLQADRASVLLFDENGVMRFQAWRGLSKKYRQAVDGHSPWSPAEKNPQPIVTDVETDPDLEELRHVILAEGICTLGFIPLISGGRLLGKFMLYYNKPHQLQEEEIHLAQSIASQIAFAIDRKQAEEALQKAKDDLERRVEIRTALLKNQIAERKRAEEALRKETAFVQLLQKIAVAANEAVTVEAALHFTLEEICAHIGWPVGHVFVAAANGSEEMVSSSIWYLAELERFERFRRVTESSRFGSEESIPGQVQKSGEAVWIADVHQDPNFLRTRQVVDMNVRAGFAFPVMVGTEVVAVLEFFAEEVMEPDEALLVVASNIGRQIGRVIERDRAETALKKSQTLLRRLAQQVVSAQEEERRRVSRELHDEAGQALTVLRMNLAILREGLPVELVSLRQHAEEAIDLIGHTMDQIRFLAHALHPPVLENLGLNAALEGVCRDFVARTQLSVAYTGQDVPPLPDAVNISFYRFLQEALTNVVKHAQADKVEVSLRHEERVVSLTVADDGRGFDAGSRTSITSPQGGLGLLGMRERFGQLGGELEIESRPGRGTRLVASHRFE